MEGGSGEGAIRSFRLVSWRNLATRAYYSDDLSTFFARSPEEIIGLLTTSSSFDVTPDQRSAWLAQIDILRDALGQFRDAPAQPRLYFEYAVPRMGRWIDAVLVIRHVVFVLEFKVGADAFTAHATDQVFDYALDLKNFHETSHHANIAPVLIATAAASVPLAVEATARGDGLLRPIHTSPADLGAAIEAVLTHCRGDTLDPLRWESGRYSPTPSIIEAAIALYSGHSVADLSRSDASAVNLGRTTGAVSEIIHAARARHHKAICFLTGVPGAGKTLVGLNIATQHIRQDDELYSVFLSGNGPLVAILREALARDRVARGRANGARLRKGEVLSEVKAFIQNVHNFRDDSLINPSQPPAEHVALFDEAQRAWDLEQTRKFMQRKRGVSNFAQSEPEFLISCMNRHSDWAVVVCLVGGGQEINTGEAGISEWIGAVLRSFPDWHVHISPRLHDSEYGAGALLDRLEGRANVCFDEGLHLSVSMRSFRAEHVSALVKVLLDLEEAQARQHLERVRENYPIVLTRSLSRAKRWLKEQARGSERYGIVVSSEAQRLKPHAIDVRVQTDPVNWFLAPKTDVRSSYYLEDVATEFDVQGLELDWAAVVWDGDFRYSDQGWKHYSFVGDRWNRIHKSDRQSYLKNAYRVLLTRARQGMVVVVPEGADDDPTRCADFYDPTFEYLCRIGLKVL